MSSFTAAFEIARPAQQVFDAIRDVRGWWSGAIDGSTANAGDEFTYEVADMHWCRFRITEVVPYSRISWLVLDSWLTFTDVKDEWNGTTVVFDVDERDGLTEVRFTHEGLVPDFECYELCSDAWTGYVTGSLRHLILTGAGHPNPTAPVSSAPPAH